jgi:hypothetical protein
MRNDAKLTLPKLYSAIFAHWAAAAVIITACPEAVLFDASFPWLGFFYPTIP